MKRKSTPSMQAAREEAKMLRADFKEAKQKVKFAKTTAEKKAAIKVMEDTARALELATTRAKG